MRVPTYYQDLFDVIGSNPGHVIASTACLGGAFGTQLLKFRQTNDLVLYDKIKFWCVQLLELFGEGNFYLEVQDHLLSDEKRVAMTLKALSEETGIVF